MIVMDANGVERARLEGYLSRIEFRAWLEMGLARLAFMKKRWEEAEAKYSEVVERYADTSLAPEAVYWRGVCQYKRTNDHTVLGQVPEQLNARYKDSVWALKASVWGH